MSNGAGKPRYLELGVWGLLAVISKVVLNCKSLNIPKISHLSIFTTQWMIVNLCIRVEKHSTTRKKVNEMTNKFNYELKSASPVRGLPGTYIVQCAKEVEELFLMNFKNAKKQESGECIVKAHDAAMKKFGDKVSEISSEEMAAALNRHKEREAEKAEKAAKEKRTTDFLAQSGFDVVALAKKMNEARKAGDKAAYNEAKEFVGDAFVALKNKVGVEVEMLKKIYSLGFARKDVGDPEVMIRRIYEAGI